MIDSIEKIAEGEIGHMEYDYAYEILQELGQAAVRFEVPILVTMHEEDFGDGNKWNKVLDTVMRLEKDENQNSKEYMLHLEEKDRPCLKLKMAYDTESSRWITSK